MNGFIRESGAKRMRSRVLTILVLMVCSLTNAAAFAQAPRDLSWLTQKQRDWLKEHPLIRVAPTPDFAPFEIWETNEATGEDEFTGVVSSYLKFFSAELGVEFELIRTKTWQENLDLLEAREIDAIPLIVPSEQRDFVAISKPYVKYPGLIVVRKDTPGNLDLDDLAGKKVAVPDNYTGEYFLRSSHPEIIVVEVVDPAEGIRMLSSGEVDAYFGGASVVTYMAEKEGITNLRIAGESDFNYANGFGVRDDWLIFADIISRTLDRMSPAEHRAISAEWVTTDYFQKHFYEYRQFWWILGLLLLGTGAVLVWNRKQAAFIDELEEAQRLTELVNVQLEEARKEAEEANAAKSSFVANISHEIRTPMNGVLGMCELMRGTGLNDQQREYLEFASSSAENLVNLIDDILDFSKIEAGKLDLEERPFAISPLIDELVGLMNAQAKPAGLSLDRQIDSGVGDYYIGDPLRIRQIILNLISNAIKFTKTGGVHVRVFREQSENRGSLPDSESENGSHLIRFEVEDSGIGVAEDKLEHIFKPFEQENSSTTRNYGGTGLGLAICKTLAEKMGGQAFASSQRGKGSVFGFTARLQLTTAPAVKPKQISAGKDNSVPDSVTALNILLVEDILVNQKVAIALLEKRGHKVQLAEDGQQALDAMAENEYDIVLMDIGMPVMDGLTAVERLREREKTTGLRQRVVAMTGHAMMGDRERFIESGMDGHLVKPFKPADLYAVVEQTSSESESSK